MTPSISSANQYEAIASRPIERRCCLLGRKVERFPIRAGEDWKKVLEEAHTDSTAMDFSRLEEFCWTGVLVPAYMLFECRHIPNFEETVIAVMITAACFFMALALREKRFKKIAKLEEFQRLLSNPVNPDILKLSVLNQIVSNQYHREEASLDELLNVHAEWKKALQIETPD
jgi:hypothetical protein